MLRNVLVRFVTESVLVDGFVRRTASVRSHLPNIITPARTLTDFKDDTQKTFDSSLLDFLVCPLSKKTLRFDPKTNELINEELGIAYPIIHGIPNMIPQEARLLPKTTTAEGQHIPS
ncbi:protein preY, mitochondrial-like [Dunckerocampus dactyliophorus]|uniref:protein preY, mitochondrial-like n=1 Tax=Dunckerocampus dactyliophorus TaxID=161453 RepID=UPI0024052EAD|nr:protein preY, mitochondrial-like [Dunckerocampus dactyliophorus]